MGQGNFSYERVGTYLHGTCNKLRCKGVAYKTICYRQTVVSYFFKGCSLKSPELRGSFSLCFLFVFLPTFLVNILFSFCLNATNNYQRLKVILKYVEIKRFIPLNPLNPFILFPFKKNLDVIARIYFVKKNYFFS